MFLTGQKVVCVDDQFDPAVRKFYTALPVRDSVYVVRGLAPGITVKREDEIAVYLIGLTNPCSEKPPHRERGFKPERFVPLQELTEEQILAASQPEEAEELIPIHTLSTNSSQH